MSQVNHYLPRFFDGTLANYTSLGGYTLFYICKDDSCLCPDCANKQEKSNQEEIFAAIQDHIFDTLDYGKHLLFERWRNPLIASQIIVAADINYEDCALYCDECSARIQPSYKTDEDCAAEDCS